MISICHVDKVKIMITVNKFTYILFSLMVLPIVAHAALPYECGRLKNGYGPFDFTNKEHQENKLPIVQGKHFTPRVERLISGESGALVLDIDYTLRAFPNHHNALHAMARYQLKNPRPLHAKYFSVDCYFSRAIEFKKDDDVVRMLYGIYFYKLDKYKDALAKFKDALAIKPDSASVNYNIGLTYIKLNDYEKAKKHAVLAYKYGHKLSGLKKMLKNAGYWDD